MGFGSELRESSEGWPRRGQPERLVYVCMYVCMYVLGALVWAQRINRWLANVWTDRGGRAGKLEQPNAGRM